MKFCLPRALKLFSRQFLGKFLFRMSLKTILELETFLNGLKRIFEQNFGRLEAQSEKCNILQFSLLQSGVIKRLFEA